MRVRTELTVSETKTYKCSGTHENKWNSLKFNSIFEQQSYFHVLKIEDGRNDSEREIILKGRNESQKIARRQIEELTRDDNYRRS